MGRVSDEDAASADSQNNFAASKSWSLNEKSPSRDRAREHLAAIALQTGRAKDKARLLQFRAELAARPIAEKLALLEPPSAAGFDRAEASGRDGGWRRGAQPRGWIVHTPHGSASNQPPAHPDRSRDAAMRRRRSMRSLELKIPPVAFWLLTAAFMGLAAWAAPGLKFAMAGSRVVAAALLIVGAGIGGLGVVAFRRAKTTVHPLQPAKASTLVATGIYRVSRNPMYLGLLVCLLGWAVLLSSFFAFLLLPLFVLGMNRWQIVPEERALALRFGPEFAAYKIRTRRWL